MLSLPTALQNIDNDEILSECGLQSCMRTRNPILSDHEPTAACFNSNKLHGSELHSEDSYLAQKFMDIVVSK